MFQKGDFVPINGEVGAIVTTGEELPGDIRGEDHTRPSISSRGRGRR